MQNFSESIARKMKRAANQELAKRYERRLLRSRAVEDRDGRRIEVVSVKRRPRSNGLLDD